MALTSACAAKGCCRLPSLFTSISHCAVAQVAAAREAIGDADFFLIARTDARATSSKRGLDEAINRANIYLASALLVVLTFGLAFIGTLLSCPSSLFFQPVGLCPACSNDVFS